MVVSQHLIVDGSHFSPPTLYQSLVGALQCLTIMHIDIAHSVNFCMPLLHITLLLSSVCLAMSREYSTLDLTFVYPFFLVRE